MPIANVQITDTFETWRTRFNQTITTLNDLTSANGINNLTSNTITALQSLVANTGNVFFGTIGSIRIFGGTTGQFIRVIGNSSLEFVDQPGANGFSDLTGTISNSQYGAVHAPAVGTWTQAANTTFSSNVNLGAIADVHITGGVVNNWLRKAADNGLTFANVNFSDLEGTVGNTQYTGTHAPVVATWTQAANTTFNANVTFDGLEATFNQDANFPNDAVFTGNANFQAATTSLQGANTVYLRAHYPDAFVTLGTIQSNTQFDMANGNFFTLTANGTFTIDSPLNANTGQCGALIITQDIHGNSVVSWTDAWQFSGNTAPTLTAANGAVDRVDYIVVSANAIQAVASLDYQ